MKPRFTTGELARLNGISKQTLIFYDRAGVFSPNEKDPRNGYRYYGADQLEVLDPSLILKDMGLSLQEIRASAAPVRRAHPPECENQRAGTAGNAGRGAL